MSARFASVVLDVDSTVSGVEGIDWLAQRRGPETAAKIVEITDRAMRGLVPLESVYGGRLAEIRPTRGDVAALARAYIEQIADGCADVIARLRGAGVRVVLVSGGLRQAILPLAAHLGIAASDLSAVDVYFDEAGDYAGFDTSSPLTTSSGKHAVIESLELPRPSLGAGDGATDLAMRGAVDEFGAFVGFAARPAVVQKADVVFHSFREIETRVLGDSRS